MSYCRTAPNCDVYAWDQGDSIVITTAVNEQIPGYKLKKGEPFGSGYRPWDHPYAGKYYQVETPREAIAIFQELRNNGVRFPDDVFVRLKREVEEAENHR